MSDEERSSPASASPTPDLSHLIGTLLSNPAAMSAAAGMLGSLFGSQGQKPPDVAANSAPIGASCPPPRVPPPPSPPACPPSGGLLPPPPCGYGVEERRRLLLALKPYLSRERCEALDYILRISELFSAIGLFGGKER